jgi:hypothetical protein
VEGKKIAICLICLADCRDLRRFSSNDANMNI